MNNDRIFSIYAATLIAGVASAMTASVMAGYAAIPSLIGFLSHWALSLGFRAAYKSFDPSFNVIPFVNRSPAVQPVGGVHGEFVDEEKLAA